MVKWKWEKTLKADNFILIDFYQISVALKFQSFINLECENWKEIEEFEPKVFPKNIFGVKKEYEKQEKFQS